MRADTPVLFFTGKGGVGKTSTACSLAVALADAGRRVLLVSTDPASNLDEVLGAAISRGAPAPVPGVPGLDALNIDPVAAAQAWRERVVGPIRGALPEAVVARIEEQLSGACTVEIAAFDRFARLLGDPATTAAWDHVIFDTAPTGHTLRLLELPAAWTSFFDASTTGASCVGPLTGLQSERVAWAAALDTLRDPGRTSVVLVTRPEPGAIREAARTADELGALGIANLSLVVNGAMGAGSGDPVAVAMARRCEEALAAMPPQLSRLPREDVPLLGDAPVGLAGLRQLRAVAGPEVAPAAPVLAAPVPAPAALGFGDLVDALVASPSGVVLVMGKGGVGKTTLAARLAEAVARRGVPVTLTTTDPAAHVQETVCRAPAGLRVARIDPEEETRLYTAHVMATGGRDLDAKGRALLEEELRSPCTEEIAVFQAFAQTVAAGDEGVVIIDTAPTGHTLLLLDAAEAWHREVERKPGNAPEAVRTLLPRLRDPSFARVLLVTLPEATPVHEAAQLEDDLARAGIRPWAWVVNQTLTGLDVQDPLLRRRQSAEAPFLAEVAARAARLAIVPWVDDPTDL